MKNNSSGFALLTVVVLTWLLFGFTSSYIGIMVQDKYSTLSTENQTKALGIAEATLDEILWEYNYNDAAFTGWTATADGFERDEDVFQNTAGTDIGEYTATLDTTIAENPLANIVATIDAAGTSQTVTLAARLQPRPVFSGAMLAKGKITFTGNAFTDSYDSALGPYDGPDGGGSNWGYKGHVKTILKNDSEAIDANAASEAPAIGGDVGVGQGSGMNPSHPNPTYWGSAAYKFNREIKDANIPAIPGGATDKGLINSDDYLAPGDYYCTKIDLGGTDDLWIGYNNPGGAGNENTGQVRIWITNTTGLGFDITGGAEVHISSGTTLIVYSRSNLNFGGGGISNLNGTQFPLTFQLYGANTCTSTGISGTADLVGTIYAPYANMTLSGTSGYYGALVGNGITATGGGGVHYDVQIESGLTDGYQVEWVRKL